MPPSAISGMRSCSASATMSTAVTCGTPTPATTRVVQIEPGPTPTFTASAPASINASAASPVTMLPPTTCSRSEEHTSELQSLMRNSYAVFCLKKKNNQNSTTLSSQHKTS